MCIWVVYESINIHMMYFLTISYLTIQYSIPDSKLGISNSFISLYKDKEKCYMVLKNLCAEICKNVDRGICSAARTSRI